MALSKLPLMANATDALVDAVVRADVDTAAIGAVKWDLASLKGRMSNGSDPLDMLQADTHTAGVLAFLATRLGDGDVSVLERIRIALGAAHPEQLDVAPFVGACAYADESTASHVPFVQLSCRAAAWARWRSLRSYVTTCRVAMPGSRVCMQASHAAILRRRAGTRRGGCVTRQTSVPLTLHILRASATCSSTCMRRARSTHTTRCMRMRVTCTRRYVAANSVSHSPQIPLLRSRSMHTSDSC